jgi:DNA-binding PadR family transcriptional regulator
LAISTLGHAVLGLLAREPLSGLDLSRVLQKQVASFWHARHSQIYPELARLQATGLVAHTVVRQSDRPDKKVYRVTDAGMEALRTWVTAPTELPATRDEFIVKVASLWLAEPAQAAALLREHAQRHEERLALYEGFERDLQEQSGDELANPRSPWFATYLTLQRGLSFEREYAAWCRSAAEQVERGVQAGNE